MTKTASQRIAKPPKPPRYSKQNTRQSSPSTQTHTHTAHLSHTGSPAVLSGREAWASHHYACRHSKLHAQTLGGNFARFPLKRGRGVAVVVPPQWADTIGQSGRSRESHASLLLHPPGFRQGQGCKVPYTSYMMWSATNLVDIPNSKFNAIRRSA
jgi:hypothetical protein